MIDLKEINKTSFNSYNIWRNNQIMSNPVKLNFNPLVSIIICNKGNLDITINSIMNQSYTNYELILINNESYNYINCSSISDGINKANGEYITFIDSGDILEKNALYEVAKVINDNNNIELIYTDEDYVSSDNIYYNPFFKPCWSFDLLLCDNYINHLSIFKTSIVKKLELINNDAFEYDMLLKYIENISWNNIINIPLVLYHNNDNKEFDYYNESIKIKEEYIKRNNIRAKVEGIPSIKQSIIQYEVLGNPLVSIIIPSKDNPNILKQCIDSIINMSTYKNYEIIVVDNGSNKENKKVISDYLRELNINYIYDKYVFNYSKMCNIGVNASNGDYLLFLNDDIEVIQDNFMELLLGHAQLDYIGAVGAKLLYPNSTIIQHGGIVNTCYGPGHNFVGCDDKYNLYFNLNKINYNCIGVTGACLLISKEKYNKVNGLDERLDIAYNDVDLCFKLYEQGYYNVIRNDVIFYHHESYSRGSDTHNLEKNIRLSKDKQILYYKHPLLIKKDPFMNENIIHYDSELRLIFKNNIVEQYNIKNRKYKSCTGSVDEISVKDNIIIRGWTMTLDENNTDLERFLLCREGNNIFRVRMNNIQRKDVLNAYNRDDAINTGFELYIDKKYLRFDLFKYQFGFEIIGKNDTYITWLDKYNDLIPFDIELSDDDKKFYNYYSYLSDYKLHNKHNRHVNWNIDEINVDDCFHIKGYVFNNNNYKYNKYLLFKTINGWYKFEVFNEKRYDVSINNPKVTNLIFSGFKCNFIKDFFDDNQNYEIIIHLENIYDENDIIDINTNMYIKKDSN